jgi:hypothetical protein
MVGETSSPTSTRASRKVLPATPPPIITPTRKKVVALVEAVVNLVVTGTRGSASANAALFSKDTGSWEPWGQHMHARTHASKAQRSS